MQRKQKGNVVWLEFDLLANIPNLRHGVFLRHGGCSTTPYDSLNMADNVGDDPAVVQRNKKLAMECLNIPRLDFVRQCHGKDAHEISANVTENIPQADALITSQPNVGLMITHADCQAAIIYDPTHHALAMVHSGWRGSIQNIYAATIEKMKARYQSQPSDLLVCISPSLGPSSAQFINYRQELPETFLPFQTTPEHFDFWEISRMQLKACGVLNSHIEIAEIDTLSNPQDFYSFRREKVTGRHATVASAGA
ncbi:MAG: peptidoglycan editing factor PgeF [Parachlamydiaceae bacterium]|nr:peptidoglycan editing factor PgeF [Parachlamydiaceae bacterium]